MFRDRESQFVPDFGPVWGMPETHCFAVESVKGGVLDGEGLSGVSGQRLAGIVEFGSGLWVRDGETAGWEGVVIYATVSFAVAPFYTAAEAEG